MLGKSACAVSRIFLCMLRCRSFFVSTFAISPEKIMKTSGDFVRPFCLIIAIQIPC